ncbi:Acetoin utilization deacetylase AcuC [Desulfonispora thiosulfatigenes DSM 11270]|uniref:Acetoin utilization deacetylase AcuC n=1 Tax=Desulfonispora thiosulfatigenes DSM 11270 TaxID=656914 RepID=A0A1W1VP09_DESTI|nr:histone deacetylase [Desulfonispora thiosulfatigenes]SMB95089.1 Acetoin utilization deacetylase AcuC [Desulfonispora thiosulfatigenes DSM 11270]
MSNKTGLIFFPAFDWSISPTHPEREERLLYTRDQIIEEGLLDLEEIIEYKAQMTTELDIKRVHFCIPTVNNVVTDAHLVAAGSAIALGEAWHNKEVSNSFALVRPPGHHAMHITYGNRGFCNINNEAILVEYLRKKYGYKKIAIIDTDVHHGDGTQDIFYHDPDVLFISLHQDGRTLYPGTGFMNELGGPNAFAKTINIPLPPGTGDQGIDYVLDNLILPILDDFKPEIIINSAGQDNHFTDPLANMNVTAYGYGRLNQKLNPDICVLEGGYAVETALPYVNMAIILALAGKDYSYIKEPGLKEQNLTESEKTLKYLKDFTVKMMSIWKNRDKIDLTEIFGSKDIYTKSKEIYYDTDNLLEEQEESIYKCTECAGLLTYVSYLKKSAKNLCISIPIYACNECLKKGKSLFENACKDNFYHQVFLQNKAEDMYLTKDDVNG